jgi:hypothetical protein
LSHYRTFVKGSTDRIENALQYGASGGKVIVSLTSAISGEGVPEVRVTVRDFVPGTRAGAPAAAHRTVPSGECRWQPRP